MEGNRKCVVAAASAWTVQEWAKSPRSSTLLSSLLHQRRNRDAKNESLLLSTSKWVTFVQKASLHLHALKM